MPKRSLTQIGTSEQEEGPGRLCLWCAHFVMSVGESDWSEATPGSEFYIACEKGHWSYERHESERHYRACILHAVNCPDYQFNPEIQAELDGAAERKPDG